MSLLKKLAARIGIGSAEIETVLEKSTYRPGEEVRGTVHVRGGSVEEQIDDIDLYVMTRFVMVKDDQRIQQESTVASFRIVNGFTVLPKEVKSFPFHFILPLDTPVSMGNCAVWMKTDIDIKNGFDYIQVLPHQWIEKILEAVCQCGFTLRGADFQLTGAIPSRLPFVQAFQFDPCTTGFTGRLDEVEAVCQLDEQGVEVALEIESKAGGVLGVVEEPSNVDERLVRLRLHDTELENDSAQNLAEKFSCIFNQHAR